MEPNLSNELYHYGVLGMKWGVRKDRNSGSSSSKKKKAKKSLLSKKISQIKKKAAESAKERNKRRREAILNDPTKLYKNRRKFTKEEIDQAMKQFEWEGKLQQQSVDRIKRGKEVAGALLGYMTTASAMYNQSAQWYNTYVKWQKGEDAKTLPYIEKIDAKKDKPKDDKDKSKDDKDKSKDDKDKSEDDKKKK